MSHNFASKSKPPLAVPSQAKPPLVSIRELIGLIDSSTWTKIAIWSIISVITTGIPASIESAVDKFTSDSLALGFDQLFAQTAPLIWSVAMVAFACHRGWLNDGGIIPSAGLILFGGWLGHLFQHGGAVESVNWLPTDRYALIGSVVFSALNLLIAYLLTYGINLFIASVIVGSVIGMSWSRWLFSLQDRFTRQQQSEVQRPSSHPRQAA